MRRGKKTAYGKLRVDEMRALIRGEHLIRDHSDLICAADYTVRLDDVQQGLENMNGTVSVHDFVWYWLIPLWSALHKPHSNILLEEPGEDEMEEGFPDTDSNMIYETLKNGISFYQNLNGEEKADLTTLLEEIDNYRYNRGKSWKNMHLSDFAKLIFIAHRTRENRSPDMSTEEKQCYVKWLDEMCEKGSQKARFIKAYEVYGGSDLYPCDWNLSAQYLKEQMEDPDVIGIAANTLGYLYYYGRLNGTPDYTEALKYFTIGSAHGVYESTYKIGDLMRFGKGMPKDPGGARIIYWRIYADTKKDFLYHNGTYKLADTALRMAGVFEDYADAQGDPDILLYQVLGFYLESNLILALRADQNEFGDQKIQQTISEGIRRTEKKIARRAPAKTAEISAEELDTILALAPDGAEVSFRKAKSGGYTITIKVPSFDENGRKTDGRILYSSGKLGLSVLTTRFVIHTSEAWETSAMPPAKTIPVDSITGSDDGISISFSYQGTPLCTIDAEQFYIKASDLLRSKELLAYSDLNTVTIQDSWEPLD